MSFLVCWQTQKKQMKLISIFLRPDGKYFNSPLSHSLKLCEKEKGKNYLIISKREIIILIFLPWKLLECAQSRGKF